MSPASRPRLRQTTRTPTYYRVRAAVRTLVVVLPLLGGFAWALFPAYTPCATEDSTNCYWDADLAGNGEGRSFVDIDGTAYYQD